MKILQISNYQEGIGGISVQVKILCDKLRSDGYVCDIQSTKGSFFKRLLAIFRLLTRGREYDVFHIHACSDWGFLPAVLGISIGRLFKKRIILSYHGGGAEGFFRKRQKMVRFFLNRTTHNIVLSGFVGSVFDRYGIKYTVIPNVLEYSKDSFKNRSVILPRYISIRSLTDTYNINCTLRAFSLVQEKYPEAELVLLGDGPLRKELVSYVDEKGLNNVFFVGQVPNPEIAHYLDMADIMVSSSRFDNMPVSILEGFKAGLLVIASNVGGVPFMIENGKNGLLFDNDNDVQMAERMIEAVENQAASLNMIENARCSLDEYRWGNIREKLLALYRFENGNL